MPDRKRVWFEESGNRLDPALIELLRSSRRTFLKDTNTEEIPVIIKYKRGCNQSKKDELVQVCNMDSHNHLKEEIRIINSGKGHLTPEKIKEIRNHEAIERFIMIGPSRLFSISQTPAPVLKLSERP